MPSLIPAFPNERLIGLLSRLGRKKSEIEVLARFFSGETDWWTDAGENFLVITAIGNRAGGRELWIEEIVGRGMIERRHEIMSELKQIAKQRGARVVAGLATRVGLEKLYAGMGAKRVSVLFETETD